MNTLTSSWKFICNGAKTMVLLHSSETLLIPRLPRFEKLALSQCKVYIETETMTHCFVCCTFQKTILIWYAEGKERVFGILHMLRIHTGFQKLSKKNIYDLHLKQLIYLKLVNRALLLQGENCYLNNIELLLRGTNIILRFKTMMQ